MPETPTSNSSVAALHNIICKGGDSFDREFEYFQDEAETIPLDITTATFKINVWDPKTGKVVLAFTMLAGLTIVGTNKLVLSKTAADMRKPKEGVYEYDVQKTLQNGKVITIMKGSFVIEAKGTE